ncbi:T9SS type A sorting domain-containing protein [Chryseobacterium sp. NRRL B-14859]|uniref:T9SS type A sorting domain-containing protein n=1 Tax=unclassified Chryseobacterium TaxID=2593645 RepID=UPI000F45569C|nr:T9SS type A sorting domain-containing protein [Chryseobacterium sp. G0240]ROI05060.1 T9SS C-terminal target domain-containing protein [Chryseobacterium sp. G0240]
MKKFILLLFLLFIYHTNITAQSIINPLTYDLTVTRSDDYTVGHIAHANASVKVDIKIGPNEQNKTFPPSNTTPQIYQFPLIATLPGTPPLTQYVKVSFTYPSYLFSGYYPLPTTVGDFVNISDPCLIDYNAQYGYGVAIFYSAPGKYTVKVTKFTCYLCIPSGNCGILTKAAKTEQRVSLVPNPSMGFSEILYTANAKETVSISVADLNGKVIKAYTIDVREGLNKLPVDIENSLKGTYIVNWKSSNGTNGSLKLIKN